MFNFFKNNISIISKCFLNQIAMTVFGLIVLIAANLMATNLMNNNKVLFHVLGALAILIYLFLLYTIFWEKGAEDKIKIDSGRMKKNNFYGLFASLWANCINILFALIIIITSFLKSVNFINNVNGIFITLFHLLNAMFLSLITIDNITPFIYIIVLLLPLLVSWGSYILGIKGFKHILPEKKRKN